jgi:hypothetical protein
MTEQTATIAELMNGLSVCHLRFTVQATQRIRLRGQPGSALRGALYNVLSDRFCPHDNLPDHQTACPVCWMLAQTDRRGPRGENIPRPLTIQPPEARTYQPGETFQFGFGLVGAAEKLLPYLLQGAIQMGKVGIGPGKGRFELIDIEEYDVLLGAYRPLLEGQRVKSPRMQITTSRVLQETPPTANRIRIQLLTPTRLISGGKLLKQIDPAVFVGRLVDRCQQLTTYYSQTSVDTSQWKTAYLSLVEQADTLTVTDKNTRWEEAFSGSRRKGGITPISGLVGSFQLQGDLRPFYPWLLWGQSLHVGKDAVKGNGWYHITQGG